MDLFINNYCILRNREIRTGFIHIQSENKSLNQLLDNFYTQLGIKYPKFYKMDTLSKTGFLTSEALLLNNTLKNRYAPEDIGVIISNSNSCIDTDVKFHASYTKSIASPALFVYTLPNIMIGEICIRNNFKGENIFFISDHFMIETQISYIRHLFENKSIKVCLGGWVDLHDDIYDSFLFLVEDNSMINNLPFDLDTINKLYAN
jgi:hypothetical protein